jgi:signal peptidase I
VTFAEGEFVSLQAENQERRSPRLSSRHALWRELTEIVLLVVTIYTFVNLSTVRAIVEGPSMQPNFYTGQLVIVNRFVYYFGPPMRGDVVVLHDPQDPSQDFIKRIVGLPGETVQMREGRVYVNGTLLEEPYIDDFCGSCPNSVWQLDADHYFILGDNRKHSLDSHRFGPINRRLIVGQAWIRYWPPQDFAIITRPTYGQVSSVPPILPTSTPTPEPVMPQLPDGDGIPGLRSQAFPSGFDQEATR